MSDSIREVDAAIFDRVWRVICEIGTAERHFNGLQQAYRALASTWLLASVGATGFVLERLGNQATPDLSIPPRMAGLLAAIGIGGGCGILLLWNLDLLVYQRLLDSNFVEGLRLEHQYPWLPPVRRNMMAVHDNRGIMPKVVWFYAASSSMLLFPAGAGLFRWIQPHGSWFATGVLVVEALLTLLLETTLIRRTNRIDFNLDVVPPASSESATSAPG